jgi:hypothetical protein
METLKSLAKNLLDEPFAKMHRLADKNLEEIGTVISGLQEKYETVSMDPGSDPEFADVTPSFEKTKELYCLILLKIEEERLIGDDFENLSAMAQSDSKTVFSHRVEIESPKEIGRDQFDVPPLQLINDWNMKSPDFSEPVPNERSDFFHDDIPNFEPESNIQTLDIAEPAQTPILFNAQSPRAREALEFARWLQGSKMWEAFGEEFRDRMICQSLCFAMEAEILLILRTGLDYFWTYRQEAVRGILNQTSPRFELNSELHAEISNVANKFSDWLYEDHFSFGSVLNSLRYIVSTKINSFEPSVFETGILILLFGQEKLGKVQLKNYLQLNELPNEMIIEGAFKLMRIQKLKNKALSVVHDFHLDHRRQLEGDIKRVIELISLMASQMPEELAKGF